MIQQVMILSCVLSLLCSLLPVPQSPSKPPTSPQYSFILPKQGEPFSFAVVRYVVGTGREVEGEGVREGGREREGVREGGREREGVREGRGRGRGERENMLCTCLLCLCKSFHVQKE